MTYNTIALALDAPVDLDEIEKTVRYYSDGKFFVEIYKNGTCVFPGAARTQGVENGTELLTEIEKHPIDFTVKEMDDHNFVVRFTNSVFSIVFRQEFNERRGSIEQQALSARGDEVIVGKPDASRDHMLIGLYARTRLLADIRSPMAVRFVAPTAAQ